MSVAIRLKQMGTKNRAFFRIVAVDSRKTRDGKMLANLGHYNPLTDPATVVIDEERVLSYLKVGATPSETVASLLKQHGIVQGVKGWAKNV
ncbi:MAG: 30S ribosomal protein S16 [Candidatus Riflebacteria bacterium]|nr:30S ribosomal protein S16 [Candidatus Riflebacteria bacterium]